MYDNQLILVPSISTLPGHEAKALSALRWLIRRGIVQEQVTTCGRGSRGMAYGIAPGAERVVKYPERLPFGHPVNGLEIITRRCIFTPDKGFKEEAGCPECRQEIGEALFDSLEDWMPGHTDNFRCPECGHEDDINGFLFLQPCGFSNLGFIFNGWAKAVFQPTFLEEFAERLGYGITQVTVEL
ncbi:sugar ABC transporter ATPase [Pseudomonas luteola]|uniref:sugar ABC transporter ATPase n=1 Tax=Pseudomonas luteola TaxID=47886 RepID=UPI00388D3302